MGGLLDCIKTSRDSNTPGGKKALPPTPEWSRPSPQLQPCPCPQGHQKPEACRDSSEHLQHSHPTDTLHSQEANLGLEDCSFFTDPSSWLSASLPEVKPQDSSSIGAEGAHREPDILIDSRWSKPSSKPKAVRRLFSDSSPNFPPPYHDSASADATPSSPIYSRNRTRAAIVSGGSASLSSLPLESNHSSTVDVNFANVHQLCVIGLTRTQAEAVVEYRVRRRRHFQGKDELKQVPGIDEETYSRIRTRITLIPAGLGMTDNVHCSASTEGELGHSQAEKGDGKAISVNLNLCNHHELCVVGLSKAQALAVVDYRFKNGLFTSTEQIKLVPGISDEIYHRVRSKLTLVPGQASKHPSSNRKQRPRVKNNYSLALNSSPLHKLWHTPNTLIPAFSTTDEQPSQRTFLAGVGAKSPVNAKSPMLQPVMFISPDVTGAKPSPRGVSGGRTGKGPVRIASWNLQCFNEKKIENLGVLEVVCSVILQHGFDVIAVQEIGSKGVLERVCEELNRPSLPKVQGFGSNARQWECCVSSKATGRMFQGMEYNGFLWNTCSGVVFEGSGMIESDQGDRLFVRRPFVGNFLIRNWKFVIVSVHLKAESWGGKFKSEVENEVRNLSLLVQSISHQVGDSDILLLGDFNMNPKSQCFQPLIECGYTHVFESDEPTNISAINQKGSMCYDNIWVTPRLMDTRYNGTRGVVRRGLQHPEIAGRQAGERGGTVSDHCPIWVGFTA